MNSSGNRVSKDRRVSDPHGSRLLSRTPPAGSKPTWSGPHYGSDTNRLVGSHRPSLSYGSPEQGNDGFERAPSEVTVNSDSFSPVRSPIHSSRYQQTPPPSTTPATTTATSNLRPEPDSAIRESFDDIQRYLHRPFTVPPPQHPPQQPIVAFQQQVVPNMGTNTPGPSTVNSFRTGYGNIYPPQQAGAASTAVPNAGQQTPLPLASVIGRYTAPTPSHYGGTGGISTPAATTTGNQSGYPAAAPHYSQPLPPSENLGYAGYSIPTMDHFMAAPTPLPGGSTSASLRNPIPAGESSWSLLLKGPLMSQQQHEQPAAKSLDTDNGRSRKGGAGDDSRSTARAKKDVAPELSSSAQAVDPMSKSPRRLSRRRPIPQSESEDDVTNQTAPTVNLTDDSNSAFIQIVWYLRRRYGDQEAKTAVPAGADAKHPSRYELSSLTDEDSADLGFLFVEEVKSLARKQRAKKGIPEPLPEPTAEEKSSRALDKRLKDMTVRDAVAELRLGGNFTKFGRRGTPSIRYICVSDRRTLHKGEMVAMPHLCWAVDSKAEPSGQLPLFELRELETGPSDTMKKNAEGFVIGVLKETFSDKQCITLIFSSRTIDIACKNLAQLAIWKRALYLIIYKNRELLAAAQRNSK